MPISKTMLAGGLTVALAVGGGATIAHELLDNPSTATGSTPTASTRPISNTTPSRIYDGAKNAVTYIVADTAQGQATGSGFVISKDGLIVTNDHVVEGATRVQVKVGTNGKAQDATVVGADPSRDLALLKVDGNNLSTLSLGDSSSVGVGDAVYAIGNPFGLDHTFTTGIVSALQRNLQAPDGATISGAIQTDAALNPGNSGGPLLDSAGQVIGVNAQIETGSQNGAEGGNVGIGFAIPSSTVKAFVQEAKDGKLAPQQSQEQQQPDQQQPDQQQLQPQEQQQQPDQPGLQLDPQQLQQLLEQQQQQLQQQQQPDQQQSDPYGWGIG